jgi:hypothetical protein
MLGKMGDEPFDNLRAIRVWGGGGKQQLAKFLAENGSLEKTTGETPAKIKRKPMGEKVMRGKEMAIPFPKKLATISHYCPG